MRPYKVAVTLFFLALLGGAPAGACSFAGTQIFEPGDNQWQKHPGPKLSDPDAEGDYWLPIPAPIVKVDRIKRGTQAAGSSCADAGLLFLEISLPPESPYTLGDFGIYLRVLEGTALRAIFSDYPLALDTEGDSRSLMLVWLDGHPDDHLPLDLKVEAFLVSPSLQIGASSTFQVQSAPGDAG